jgi:DNA-binding NtrC family response regulator
MANILLLDDDQNHLNAMWRVLWLNGEHEAERFTSPTEALARAREKEFDLVVADYRMPEMDGAQFLSEFRQLQPLAFRIILSAHADTELFRAAINSAQIHHFIQKPCDGFILMQVVSDGLAQVGLSREVVRLQAELETTRALLDRRTRMLEVVAERCPDVLPSDWAEASAS